MEGSISPFVQINSKQYEVNYIGKLCNTISSLQLNYLGRTPDLHGTLGLISWSGSTMA